MINVLALYIVRTYKCTMYAAPNSSGGKRVTLTPLHLFDVVVVWWSWIDRLAGINAQMTLKRYSADVQWSKNKGKMQFGEVALLINHKFDKNYLINSKIKISWNWLIHQKPKLDRLESTTNCCTFFSLIRTLCAADAWRCSLSVSQSINRI